MVLSAVGLHKTFGPAVAVAGATNLTDAFLRLIARPPS